MTNMVTVSTDYFSKLSPQEKKFQKTVLDFYHTQGRQTLPWRTKQTPYRVWVSEIMLQQTQVDRVLPKYRAFMKAFPSITALSRASLKDVLVLWQGLGYNRRAKMLHRCAQEVVEKYTGRFPKEGSALRALPGIGPYTAAAIQVFAYNIPSPLIETNVRTVYLQHFFPMREQVTDAELFEIIKHTFYAKDPRTWVAALMDYGTYLKKEIGNQNHRSKQYTKQSKFKGSDREIRGAIVRFVAHCGTTTIASFQKAHPAFTTVRVRKQFTALQKEELLTKKGQTYTLGH